MVEWTEFFFFFFLLPKQTAAAVFKWDVAGAVSSQAGGREAGFGACVYSEGSWHPGCKSLGTGGSFWSRGA